MTLAKTPDKTAVKTGANEDEKNRWDGTSTEKNKQGRAAARNPTTCIPTAPARQATAPNSGPCTRSNLHKFGGCT